MPRILYVPSNDSRSLDFNKFIALEFKEFLTEQNPELILVSGGDGAMLHAVHDYKHLGCPFFGNAAGTLNFMMNKIENHKEFLELLVEDKINLSFIECNLINVFIKKKDKEPALVGAAVNDVVLGSHLMGYHEFLINSSDGAFEEFSIKGSGIIVSTDLGSTGYNFNLGSPVIPLGSNLWVVSGVVCNRFLRDIIKAEKVTIQTVNAKEPLDAFMDAIKVDLNMTNGDALILEPGDCLKLAFIEETDFLHRRVDITSRYRKQ